MNVRFYFDPENNAPHIYRHHIDEEEVSMCSQIQERIAQAEKDHG